MKQLLGRSPLPHAWSALTADQCRILAYHGVSDRQVFAQQVDHLVADYHPVGIEDLHRALSGEQSLPDRAVLITFDDGNPSVVTDALPVLEAAGVPAVVYVVAGVVDTDEPFWWDEAAALFDPDLVPASTATSSEEFIRNLKQVDDRQRRNSLRALRTGRSPVRRPQLRADDLQTLVDAGVTIGNHTDSHPCLDRCDATTVRDEIDAAHERLTELLGAPPTTFAYPNGNLDRRAEAHLQRLGYESVFLFDHRPQAIGPHTDPLRLSRLRVDAHADLDTFRLLVSGAHSFLHHRVLRRP